MPHFQWEELDFLEFFGVVPEEDEEDGAGAYQIVRGGIILELTVRGWRNAVHLSLHREGAHKPLISFVFFVRGEARRRREKWGEYLEFIDCVCAPDEYASDEELFGRRQFDSAMNIVLYIQPDIRIEFE